MALPKRSTPTAKQVTNLPAWSDPEFWSQYPHLHAFLHDDKYEDGSVRITGSISFFTKGGTLTVAVNDNDRAVTAFVTAPTWAEVMNLLDEGIRTDMLEWRSKAKFGQDKKVPF